MSRNPRHNHSAGFKNKIAPDTINGMKPIVRILQKYDGYPSQVIKRRCRCLECRSDPFDTDDGSSGSLVDLKALHSRIGQLSMKKDIFGNVLGNRRLLNAR